MGAGFVSVGDGASIQRQFDLPSKNDSTSTLNIVIEALVLVPIPVEVVEGLFTLEVFELHNHFREDITGSLHELIHELLLLGHRDTLGAKTQIQRIFQVGLVGGTAIQDDWEGLVGVDTGSRDVQG